MKLLLSLSALLITGCASAEMSPTRTAEPTEKMAAAEEAGAQENPHAALYLKLANDQYALAGKAMKDGDGERAHRLLDRASLDAELALELAHGDTTKKEASAALDSIQKLHKEQRAIRAN